ncbi:MAG: DUF1566 domain-containing protein [Bacteroidales bacterium]|nr:DUF1566 domain-containing protein [Bacteroidales bacterium]
MRNIFKLMAILALAGGLAACNKEPEGPADPSEKCYFANAVDLTPIGDEYICAYDNSCEPAFVAFDGTKLLPVDGERYYITFEFIDDSNTYFFYAGFSAENYGLEGWAYGFGVKKETAPGQKGAVRVIYDDGNLKFEKTLTLIADPTGGAEAIDLGLKTKGGKTLKWASQNVGATAPEEYGSYFAWGETTQKTNYNWLKEGDYKWGIFDIYDKPNYGMTKYTIDVESGDGLKALQPGDDPAAVNWGTKWRTPTIDEIKELLDETKCEWTWDDEKKGYFVRGLATGNTIFLPAAGYRSIDLKNAGTLGYYWSSSVHESNPSHAYYFAFSSDSRDWYGGYRCFGPSVRAVTEY